MWLAIASQIQVNVNAQEQTTLRKAKAVVPEALEACLKGRFFWNKRTAEEYWASGSGLYD